MSKSRNYRVYSGGVLAFSDNHECVVQVNTVLHSHLYTLKATQTSTSLSQSSKIPVAPPLRFMQDFPLTIIEVRQSI